MALAPCLAALWACGFSKDVPPTAVVRCASDADCPAGLVCHQRVGHCALAASIDDRAPAVSVVGAAIEPRPPFRVYKPALLGARTQLSGTLKADEALSTLRFQTCPQVTCRVTSERPPFFDFQCTVNAGVGAFDSQCQLGVEAVDLAGNSSTAELWKDAHVDTVAPAPLDTDKPRNVTWTRAPWGSSETGSAPSATLRFSGAEVSSIVAVFDAPDELGEPLATSDSNTGLVALSPLVTSDLYVAVQDRAGNLSPLRLVKDLAVWATLANPPQSPDNPQRLYSAPAFGRGYRHHDALRVTGEDGVGAIDGRSFGTLGAGTWRQRSYAGSDRNVRSMIAWDDSRGRAVLFGGCSCEDGGLNGVSESVQEWTGEDWLPVIPTDPEGDGNPAARVDGAASFAPRHEAFLLFGGLGADGVALADTWVWNGDTWRNITSAVSPPARYGHAMAWSTRRGALVMAGGRNAAGVLFDDVWEFRDDGWRRLEVRLPSARAFHRMVRARSDDRVLLSGGETDSGVTWDVWELSDAGWSREASMSAGIPPRAEHGFVHDSARNAWWVLGGRGDDRMPLADSWAFVDGRWSLEATAFPLVSVDGGRGARSSIATVYDPIAKQALFLGGLVQGPNIPTLDPFQRLYEVPQLYALRVGLPMLWRWKASVPFFYPTPRVNHAQAYDSDRGVTVINGGEYGTISQVTTYQWDGDQWALWGAYPLPDGGVQRTAGERQLHNMAYDPTRKKMILFGGTDEPGSSSTTSGNVTFLSLDAGTWVGSIETGWERLTIASPPARFIHAMLWNPVAQRIELYGGTSILNGTRPVVINSPGALFEDAWSLTDAWRQIPALGALQVGVAATVDESRNATILWPGYVPIGFFELGRTQYERQADTDGGFTGFTYPVAPAPRTVENLLYDSRAERVLTYGAPATTIDNFNSDRVWQYSASGWRALSVADPERFGSPGKRAGFRWSFDRRRGRAVLYGGITTDLWELGVSDNQPAHIFDVNTERLGASAGAAVDSVELQVVASGRGQRASSDAGWEAVHGVSTFAWASATWSPLASLPAADAGAAVSFRLNVPANVLPRMLDASGHLRFAITPRGGNGNDTASISTDTVELKAWFRRP